MISVCPIQPELGAAQVHINLASALRQLGHSVRLWSPHPLPQGLHWTSELRELRGKLRTLLRSGEAFDVVDCSPHLVALGRECARGTKPRWIARSVQPDLLYIRESLRAEAHKLNIPGVAAQATSAAVVSALVYAGWRASEVVMSFGSTERAWMSQTFPWLRGKLRSYDGAAAEEDRTALAAVRRRRQPPRPNGSVRYIWIGRWSAHKGVSTLMRFLQERIDAGTSDAFTIAGCGPDGESALRHLSATGRVRVVPTFARAELPDLLADHDAGLFTSGVEGWGLVLNEMVEAGLPIYATTAGGVADIRSVLGSFIGSFPPPQRAFLPAPLTEDAFARYESRFRWSAIAERYVESIWTEPGYRGERGSERVDRGARQD
jgi:glycosyltransferase involved in cell wall biosynthesis